MSDRRRDALVFVILLLLVVAAKRPILGTPFYWDETLWIGFARSLAQHPLWHVVPGWHPPTEYGGRPPGLFLAAAAWFKAFGFSIWASHLLIVGCSLLGTYFTYRLGATLFSPTAGLLASLFLFFNAIYFAQSGMFLPDVPVAAFGVTSVYWAVRERYGPYLISATILLLLKETALAIAFAIVVFLFVDEYRRSPSTALKKAGLYAVPLFLMAGFYGYKKLVTGKFFVDYAFEFQAFHLDAHTAIEQFWSVSRWLFVMQYRWVFSLLIALNLLLNRAALRRKEILLFALIFLTAGYSFCVLYFLPRYLLPVAPYFFILAAWSLTELVRSPTACVAAAIGIIAVQTHAPRGNEQVGTREWNMSYLDIVHAHQAMCAYVEREFPHARVLTVWPFSSYLNVPDLGYVTQPMKVLQLPSDAAAAEGATVVLDGRPAAYGRALSAYIDDNHLRLLTRVEADGAWCALYENRESAQPGPRSW